MVIFAVTSLFPIYIMVVSSLKTRVEVFTIPPIWFFEPKINNYISVLKGLYFFRFFMNSTIIGLSSTFFSLATGALAAYALARFRFMGRRVVLTGTLFLRMIAPVVLVIPTFILWNKLGIIDTRYSLILSYVALNLPFCIWVLHTFMREIPISIEESALIDGCSELTIFRRIVVPLIAPGISVAAIFTFRIAWNEFPLALVLTNRYTRTLPVAVSLYMGEVGIDWSQITAIATIIAIPAFIFTFVAAKNLIMGITAGAVKG
ncbi:MAG TPA: carbohydrate ABC transporter permease [bacterium]|nr:carbohydrate ABC transporter permease [bacterium]